MSLVASFFDDAYQLKQSILELAPNCIWKFHVQLNPLICDDDTDNMYNEDDQHIKQYLKFIDSKYVTPLKNEIDTNMPHLNIHHDICQEIINLKWYNK